MTSNEGSKRRCGECTACCDGWMKADVYGHKMGDGVACSYRKGSACSIYESRPQFCRSFMCGWLMPTSPFPEQWRPDKIGLIIVADTWEQKRCWVLLHAGKEPTEDVLAGMRRHTVSTGEPHIIEKKNSWLCFGKPEFQQAMLKRGQEAQRHLNGKSEDAPLSGSRG